MRKSSIPLILTNDQANVHLPEGMFSEPETVFRMVETIGGGFFVALVTSNSFSDQEPRTLIVSWDSDLLGFIESPHMAAQLLRLHHFAALTAAGQSDLRHREVVEIWRGVDTAAGDAEVIVFVASDGTRFCGQEAMAPPRSVRIVSRAAVVGHRPEVNVRSAQPAGSAP